MDRDRGGYYGFMWGSSGPGFLPGNGQVMGDEPAMHYDPEAGNLMTIHNVPRAPSPITQQHHIECARPHWPRPVCFSPETYRSFFAWHGKCLSGKSMVLRVITHRWLVCENSCCDARVLCRSMRSWDNSCWDDSRVSSPMIEFIALLLPTWISVTFSELSRELETTRER